MRCLITTILTLTALTLILPVQQATVAGDTPCTDDYTVMVGGTGDPESKFVPFKPVGYVVRVQYPASIFPAGPVPADVSVREGVAAVRGVVAGVRVVCSGAVIRIAGYSLGAWVAGNYCDTDPSVRCILIADPRNQGGINAYLPDLPGITFGGARVPSPNSVQVFGEYDVIASAPANDLVRLIASAIGYLAGPLVGGSTHAYPPIAEPLGDLVIDQRSPIPWTDGVPALPFEVPTPRDVVEAVVPAESAVAGGPYVGKRLEVFLPPIVNGVLPEAVRSIVPPPVFPPLPKIPGLT